MVGSSYRIPIANAKDREEYKEILENIIGFAHREVAIIRSGGVSCWDADQLEQVVIPEMTQLLHSLTKGELFLKYGKQQRLLESTYLLTDSVNMISNTPIGLLIRNLQAKLNAQKDEEQ